MGKHKNYVVSRLSKMMPQSAGAIKKGAPSSVPLVQRLPRLKYRRIRKEL